jgi:murein tripeptide amidase MpaA
MQITQNFDSGNIIVDELDDPADIKLRIRNDKLSDFYQWFHFRLTGASGRDCRMEITNAGDAAYADGWKDYQPCASYDREIWFRVDGKYDGASLTISHTPEEDAVYYAYFAPYSMDRHADLVADAVCSPHVTHHMLGNSLDGQDMDLLEISDEDAEGDKLKIWFIARQHPGESMAEWWMEGFLDRLLDAADPVSRMLLCACRFYVVPNMNPDGSRRGHLRTNAAGANLNREWKDASMERSPEVFLVRSAMEKYGVDFHMDVHGDEALPYNFLAGFESIPSLKDDQIALFQKYRAALKKLSPDFQDAHGYPADAAGSSDLRKCTDYTAETFDSIAMTLEMPFKDNADLPDEVFGWSPDRCRHLARACLDALHAVLDDLKNYRA